MQTGDEELSGFDLFIDYSFLAIKWLVVLVLYFVLFIVYIYV